MSSRLRYSTDIRHLLRATCLAVLALGPGCSSPKPPEPAVELSDAAMAQAQRIYSSVEAAEQEYQRLFAETKYPNDAEKKKASDWIASKETMFHLIRLMHSDLQTKRTRVALTLFAAGTMLFVESPESQFSRYDFGDKSLRDGKEVYGNLSKIETIVSEYRVLMLSALREIK